MANGLTDEMMGMARDAEKKYGDEWAILLEPNVGNAASPIYSFADGETMPTQWQQATSDCAEADAMKGMYGVVIISSHWDDEGQEFVASYGEIENDEDAGRE